MEETGVGGVGGDLGMGKIGELRKGGKRKEKAITLCIFLSPVKG